jgi:hypothetical protein
MTADAVKSYYTTTGGVIGSATVSKRAPVGWEAIQPKPNNKPEYLLKAREAEADAWENYLWLVDTLERSEKWDYEAVNDAWDLYEDAKRKAKAAYNAYCQGLDFIPCEF